jgi:hypothetical protein
MVASSEWAELWHVTRVIIPRRSISGKLLWGTVYRRRHRRRWIYKKFSPVTTAPASQPSVPKR